MLPLWPANFI